MTVSQIFTFGIIVVFIFISFILGIRQLLHKGECLNNAYIYKHDDKLVEKYINFYYNQSGVVFLLISVVFIFVALYTYTTRNIFRIIEFVIVAITIAYALISSKMIFDKIKKLEGIE